MLFKLLLLLLACAVCCYHLLSPAVTCCGSIMLMLMLTLLPVSVNVVAVLLLPDVPFLWMLLLLAHTGHVHSCRMTELCGIIRGICARASQAALCESGDAAEVP